MTLRSNYVRVALKTLSLFLFVLTIAAFEEHARTGHWWSKGYFESFAIPCIVMIVFVCVVFVPSRLTLTNEDLSIDRLILPDVVIPLEELESYLDPPSTFMLQVRGQSSAYQISGLGFRRQEWRSFKAELKRRFPDRRARFFIGPRLFGRRPS